MADPVANLDEIRELMAHLPGPDLEPGTAAAARRAPTDKAGRRARPARGAGGLARDVAGTPPAAARPPAHAGVRRQSRRRGARRLGLSGRGHGADGAELHRRRRRGEPAVPAGRCRSAGLRDEPRHADRRHRRGAGDERGGMRPRDGLRDDGGRAGHRRAGDRRDGDRQHDRRGGAVRRAVRRRGGSVDRARNRGRRAPRSTAKRAAVAAAVARHRPAAGDPFDMLRRLGGLEFAAMAGAVMAARLGRVPVVLDGFASTAAAAVLFAADPRALDHCVVGHVSAEPGHRRLLERIGQRPLLRSRHAARRSLGRDARAVAC